MLFNPLEDDIKVVLFLDCNLPLDPNLFAADFDLFIIGAGEAISLSSELADSLI